MELKQKTKVSSRTLAKNLHQWTKIQVIEKKVDVESGKYPYPVLYKATPELTAYINAGIAREEIAENLEPAINETKDPLFLLDAIHSFSQVGFLQLLTFIQENKIQTHEFAINIFAEFAIWRYYKQFMYKLINASRKIINDLNIHQLLIEQAKRQIIIYATTLKMYEKIQQKNAVPSENAHKTSPLEKTNHNPKN